MASIEEVFEELNFPSAPRLKRVLTDRGIPLNALLPRPVARGGHAFQQREGAVQPIHFLKLLVWCLRPDCRAGVKPLEGLRVLGRAHCGSTLSRARFGSDLGRARCGSTRGWFDEGMVVERRPGLFS